MILIIISYSPDFRPGYRVIRVHDKFMGSITKQKTDNLNSSIKLLISYIP